MYNAWNNGKSGARLVHTSSTMPGLQIHKFDHNRTANTIPTWWLVSWDLMRPIGAELVTTITSPSSWGTHFLYLSNPASGNLLPIIPWIIYSSAHHASGRTSQGAIGVYAFAHHAACWQEIIYYVFTENLNICVVCVCRVLSDVSIPTQFVAE